MLTVQVSTSRRPGRPSISSLPYRSNANVSPYGLPLADDVSSMLQKQDDAHPLSEKALADLDRISHPMPYPEGAIIFAEGQAPRGVFILCRGRVKLTTTNREGKTFILRIAEACEFLGLHAVVTGKAYEVCVETLYCSELAFINRSDFLRFLKDHPDACIHVATQISNECQAAYETIRSIGLAHSASEKLGRLLLQWRGDGWTGKNTVRLKLPLTHEEIAQLIGTSRETVTRILSEFKRKQIVELSGSTLSIRNMGALEKLVEV
jgi:CRP/FNR family cyclic AMP-dependent transcriptional regulator